MGDQESKSDNPDAAASEGKPDEEAAELVEELGLLSDEELDGTSGGLRIGIRYDGRRASLRDLGRTDIREGRFSKRLSRIGRTRLK